MRIKRKIKILSTETRPFRIKARVDCQRLLKIIILAVIITIYAIGITLISYWF